MLAYVYIDIVSPQRLTYYLLNSVPISLIAVALAVGGWLVADDKSDSRVAPRQVLIVLLLGWCCDHHAAAPISRSRRSINGTGCGRRWPSPPSCR